METLNVFNDKQLVGTVTKTDHGTFIYEPKESVLIFQEQKWKGNFWLAVL